MRSYYCLLFYNGFLTLTSVQLLVGPNVGRFILDVFNSLWCCVGNTGETHPIPTPRGNILWPGAVTLARALTKFVVRRAAMFAGSLGSPVLVVNDR